MSFTTVPRLVRIPAMRSLTTANCSNLARAFSSTTIARAGPWSDVPTRKLNQYIVIAEDYNDAGANARRLEVRERHLEAAQKGKQAGRVSLGGALLKRDFNHIDSEVGPGVHMGGSVMIVHAESVEEVQARLNQDEYMRASVWDPSKTRIFPFLQAALNDVPTPPKANIGQGVAARSSSTGSNVFKSVAPLKEAHMLDQSAQASASLSAGSRKSEPSLLQLRKEMEKNGGKGHKIVTLGALRKIHNKRPIKGDN
ncbi:hypothetical protein IE53DRAFT_384593 [Violaceomyces palustris]|uniref:Uncharacterized protein n=1 Tax=Violaceomyces palustris TaxID=1673888 RepID=A0ACD0P4E3_9BASI|nr:hypothetical protein IE53DRAFT_384593 [Violaceomyces palustris]